MILEFGKFKGKHVKDVPKSYKKWLLTQSWFTNRLKYSEDESNKRALKSLYKDLVGNKKVHTVNNYVYLAEGIYLKADGDTIENPL